MSLQWVLPLTSDKRLTDPIHLVWGRPKENVPVKNKILCHRSASVGGEEERLLTVLYYDSVEKSKRKRKGEPDDDEDDESD